MVHPGKWVMHIWLFTQAREGRGADSGLSSNFST